MQSNFIQIFLLYWNLSFNIYIPWISASDDFLILVLKKIFMLRNQLALSCSWYVCFQRIFLSHLWPWRLMQRSYGHKCYPISSSICQIHHHWRVRYFTAIKRKIEGIFVPQNQKLNGGVRLNEELFFTFHQYILKIC